jgi:hypothetical protein
MALALKVEKLDTLPEAVRGLYKANAAGGFDLEVDGLEDTTGLKTALEKEREANKKAKKLSEDAIAAALAPFQGIDPVKTKALLAKFDNEEEATLIAAGKIDEVMTKRMAKRETELQKQVDAANQGKTVAEGVAGKFKTRVLDNHIRAAAGKSGLHPFAVEDALLRARSIFSLNDDGDAIQLGTDGQPVLGKDGKTPFKPEEWLESMKESAPHWFPAGNVGGGAGGGAGGGNAKTMKRATFDALATSAKAKAAREHVIID